MDPLNITLCLVEVIFQTLGALLSVWAGLGRGRRMWRGVVVLVVAAMLLPARAYQPAVVFVLQAIIVAASLFAWQNWRIRGQHCLMTGWRFSLSDLLHGLFLFCGLLALLLHCFGKEPEMRLLDILALSTLHALLILAVVWLVLGVRRWRWLLVRALFVAGAVLLAVQMRVWLLQEGFAMIFGTGFPYFYETERTRLPWFTVGWPICLIVVLFCIDVQLARVPQDAVTIHRKWPRTVTAGLLAVLGICAGLMAIVVGFRLTFLPKLPADPTITPNGFDTLLHAASLLKNPTGIARSPRSALTMSQLETVIHDNAVGLSLAKDALKQPWGRGLERPMQSNSDSEFRYHRKFQDVGQKLALEMELAVRRHQPELATQSALEAIQLGTRLRSHGLIDDTFIGMAIEGHAAVYLRKNRADFDRGTCRRVAAALVEELGRHDNIDTILAQDRLWSMHYLGYAGALEVIMQELFGLPDSYGMEITVLRSCVDADAGFSLLALEIAIRAYRLEHNRLPQSLNDLVPGVLPYLPLDPCSLQPFTYRRISDSEFVLYGYGLDGDDDGGVVTSRNAAVVDEASGDQFLDRPE